MAQVNAGLAVVARYRIQEQGGDPANPAAGHVYLYQKADGFYVKRDDGTVLGPIGVRYYTYTVAGDLTVDPGVFRIYNLTGKVLIISQVHIAVNTVPTGATILVDVHENGTTIFTVQGNRPSIGIGSNTGFSVVVDDSSWASGNYLQVDVDQIGSVAAGADLTVTIIAS